MPDRPQSANRLTERIHAAVRSAVARAAVSNILVACSGGADSTCLLHAVATVARRADWRVAVCHVRHGVRADDARDADAVRATAARLGLACRIVSLDLRRMGDDSTPSEAEMRDARYRALAAVADEMCADAVLTGHTLDDQAETVLLHLLRGAGVDGLGGMGADTARVVPPAPVAGRASDGSGYHLRVVRPLLSVRREETVAYCAAHGLAVASDPTNDDVRYTRNWLRRAILPALGERNPDIAVVLARAADTIREDAAFLAAETAAATARCDGRFEPSCATLDHAAFLSEHIAIRRRVLRAAMQRLIGGAPRAADVDAMQRHAAATTSTAIRRYGGVACALAFGRLILGSDDAVSRWVHTAASRRFPLYQGAQTLRGDATVRFGLPDPSVAAYAFRLVPAHRMSRADGGNDAVAMPLQLPEGYRAIVRNRAPTDRFWPPGGDRPLLLRTYLRARGVPAPVRDRLPLLVVNDTIAWVIGHTVGAEFAATGATATHIGLVTRRDA